MNISIANHRMNTEAHQPYILVIDSATPSSSVALTHGAELLCHETLANARGAHASTLAPMVDRLLAHLRKIGAKPDAVILSSGPGSYTGLRIASSLAKGICLGYTIPLYTLSTLEMMVHSYLGKIGKLSAEERIYPMIDARRMEVYTATFDGTGRRLSPDTALVLEPSSPLEELKLHTCHLVGDGAGKCTNLWEEYKPIVAPDIIPDTQYIASLALNAYLHTEPVDTAYWTPNYLKEYVAIVAKNKVLGI